MRRTTLVCAYRGKRIAMFNTKTEKFQNGRADAWTAPTRRVDKNGDAWTGSMLSDRGVALDPKTGQFTDTCCRVDNIRRVFVDSTTTPVTFWVAQSRRLDHQARAAE